MPSNTEPLIRKLESIGELSDQDREALASLPVQVRNLEADEDVVREGDVPSVCCLLLDGFMHRYKVLPDGKRQILALHTPGDVPDLLSLFLHRLDHNLAASVFILREDQHVREWADPLAEMAEVDTRHFPAPGPEVRDGELQPSIDYGLA